MNFFFRLLWLSLVLGFMICGTTAKSCSCSGGQVYKDNCGNEYAICYREKWRCDHVKGGWCSGDKCACSPHNKPIPDKKREL